MLHSRTMPHCQTRHLCRSAWRMTQATHGLSTTVRLILLFGVSCGGAVGLPLHNSSVTYVDLSKNMLAGALPASWLSSPSLLETVNLASNNITGTIPGMALLPNAYGVQVPQGVRVSPGMTANGQVSSEGLLQHRSNTI